MTVDHVDPLVNERRALWTRTYFDHDRDRHRQQHGEMDLILDSNPVPADSTPSPLRSTPRALPPRLHVPATRAAFLSAAPLHISPDQFFGLIGTTGVLVWHDGAIVHEQYRHGHDAETRWMTNSASKLVVGMLVAAAQRNHLLGDDDTQLVSVWPGLVNSGWDGVTIGHCMAMTTGVDFDEESLDLEGDSPYSRLFSEVAFGSIERFVASLGRRTQPGTEVRYCSLDTEALGGVLIRATGGGIASYLSNTIWKPAGMERDAYWVTDTTGRELALSGLCATLRDYSRLGLILLNNGTWNGHDLVPEQFAKRLAAPPDDLFDLAGHDDYPLLVWDQAFIPSRRSEQGGDYMAAGSYGQMIYVNPTMKTVVAHQGVMADISMEYVDMYRAFMVFRQIAAHYAGTQHPTADGLTL